MKHLLLTLATVLSLSLSLPFELEQASLLEQVKAERSKITGQPTEAQIGVILNKVAWDNRFDGWGLNRKEAGNHCPSPAGSIACDILHHKPTNALYDVFRDIENGATPQWTLVGTADNPDRPWVAPMMPPDGGPPPPPPPTNCQLCEVAKAELDRANVRLRDDLEISNRHAIRIQAELDTVRKDTSDLSHRLEAAERALAFIKCRAKAPSWMKIGCEIIK